MGVKSLWNILAPTSRAVRLEALAGKVLAIDASIWLYSFVKAMRDAHGDAVDGAHLLGFFRRICKLLFWGVKPVFVFDGAAPPLKQATMGKAVDVRKTAQQLLTAQLQLSAATAASSSLASGGIPIAPPTKKRKTARDPFALPSIDNWTLVVRDRAARAVTSGPAREDPRMPARPEELEDLSDLDFDPSVVEREDAQFLRHLAMLQAVTTSSQAAALPDDALRAADRFRALPHAVQVELILQLKDQSRRPSMRRLAKMIRGSASAFDFSKHQIKNLMTRNFLTQRLHAATGFGEPAAGKNGKAVERRVASDRNRSYVLVKNDEDVGFRFEVRDDAATARAAAALDRSRGLLEVIADQTTTSFPLVGGDRVLGIVGDATSSDEEDARSAAAAASAGAFAFASDSDDDDEDDFEPVFVGPLPPEVQDMMSIVPPRFAETFAAGLEMLHSAAGWAAHDLRAAAVACRERLDAARAAMVADPAGITDFENLTFWEDYLDKLLAIREAANDDVPATLASRAPRGRSTNATAAARARFAAVASDSSEDDDEMEVVEPSHIRDQFALPSDAFKSSSPGYADFAAAAVMDPVGGGDFGIPPTSAARVSAQSTPATRSSTRSGSAVATPSATRAVPAPGFVTPAKRPRMFEVSDSEESDSDNGDEAEVAAVLGLVDRLPPAFGQWQQSKARAAPAPATGARARVVLEMPMDEDGPEAVPPLPPQQVHTVSSDEDDLMEVVATLAVDEVAQRVPTPSVVVEVLSSSSEDESGDDAFEVVTTVASPAAPAPVPASPPPASLPPPVMAAVVSSGSEDDDEDDMFEVVATVASPAAAALVPTTARGSPRSVSPPPSASPTPAVAAGSSDDDDMDVFEVVATVAPPAAATPARAVVRDSPHRASPPLAVPASGSDDDDDDDAFEVVATVAPPLAPAPASTVTPPPALAEPAAAPAPAPLLPPPHPLDDEEAAKEEAALLKEHRAEEEQFAMFLADLQQRDAATVQADLAQERVALLEAKIRTEKRDADTVTPEMVAETQHLLRLFGIPYVTAPFEAEAQCAWLAREGLVDGVVSDDSDCFLFGAPLVYKNMFSNAKYVECFAAATIAQGLQLDVPALIALAQLLGSDYAPGIPGIGAVAAMEVLAAFPGPNGLADFAAWASDPVALAGDNDDASLDLPATIKAIRRKLRRLAAAVPASGFPDPRVTDAYLHPTVDENREPWAWGVPQSELIKDLLWERIQMNPDTTDATLLPIVAAVNRARAERQTTLLSFGFMRTTDARARTKGIASSRMQRAVEARRMQQQQGLAAAVGAVDADEEAEESSGSGSSSDSDSDDAAAPSTSRRGRGGRGGRARGRGRGRGARGNKK
ncbi:DNA repair protein rad2 [Blastocladiella emersonii ATCC 22665]|nr:DNA repair protein rad2 [Blastocladiella emersonii ATCC 22665]